MCELELTGGLSSGQWRKDGIPSPMQMDTIVHIEGLTGMKQSTSGDDVLHDFKECFELIFNDEDVQSHDPAGRTLASYGKEAV